MQNNEQYWERRALIRLTDAEKTSLIYEKKIRKAYRKAERDIEQEIEKIYSSYAKDVGLSKSQLKMLLNAKETSDIWKKLKAKGYDSYIKNNYKARISRLEAIKAQLYEKSKDVGKVEQKNLKQALRKVFKDSYSKTNYDICKETNIDAFSSLDDKTVDTVINSKWHGDNYSTRVWNNTEVLAAKLDDVMTRSVMTGASMSKAMREIRETFNTHNYYAERLIRTETNRAHNEAEALAYDNMGVKEYVFVATLDNRTSLMCQEHDQKRYKLSERKVGVNYPPLHPNCRSTVRAFIDEETERIMQRRARNPMTGETEVVGNMNYQQWMKKHQSEGSWKESNYQKVRNEINQTKEQYERYKKVLGDSRLPGSLEDFSRMKKENPEEWKKLQKEYRVVNQYHNETDTPMDPAKIYELHKAAKETKRNNFSSKYKKDGNIAAMEVDGEKYYAHSRASVANNPAYEKYKGDKGRLVLQPNKQHYRTLNVDGDNKINEDGWDRKIDSEAKLLEYAHTLITQGNEVKSVSLLSELPCCPSCLGVIEQFQKEHPNVILSVVSTKTSRIDITADSPKDKKGFVNQWKI